MKFSDQVYFRKMYFTFATLDSVRSIAVYATLLKGEKSSILVDCGVSYNLPDIELMAQEAGISLADVKAVINTHCHGDHAGCNSILKARYPDLQFWCHPAGQPFLEDSDLHFKTRPVPCFKTLTPGNVPVSRTLQDGEIIDDLGYPVQVLYTPGHSADSISLWLPEQKLLLTGDSLMNMAPTTPFYEDAAALEESTKRCRDLHPKYIISGFNGLWDMDQDGDFFEKAFARMDTIQSAVDQTLEKNPNATPQEAGEAALAALNVHMPTSPLFLAGIKSNMGRTKK